MGKRLRPDLLSQILRKPSPARLETVLLEGFRLGDLGTAAQNRLWLRGGFPLAYTARSEADSVVWRRQFLQTFLERDIPQLGIQIPAPALRRFWNMVAHYHAQTWNGAELARALAVSESTVRRYLDLLTGVFMLRQLPPWFENLSKRQVKAPKVFVRDSGLLHALLGIANRRSLELHPKVGASWEGFAVEEALKALRPDEAYFWATHQGAELDLLLFKDGRRLGVECKRVDAPTLTPSMRIALDDLKLDRLIVIYPGDRRYGLAEHARKRLSLVEVGRSRPGSRAAIQEASPLARPAGRLSPPADQRLAKCAAAPTIPFSLGGIAMSEPQKKSGSCFFTVLKLTLLVVVLAAIAIAGLGLFVLDGKYDVAREIDIKASPQAVHKQVGDLREWPNWLPFTKADPSIKVTIDQPTGVGANQHWTGKSGNGKLTFAASDEEKGIEYEMVFDDKWVSKGSMTYTKSGDDTRVVWHMTGQNDDFMGKWMALAMGYMVGPKFEEGLADLKKKVESQ